MSITCKNMQIVHQTSAKLWPVFAIWAFYEWIQKKIASKKIPDCDAIAIRTCINSWQILCITNKLSLERCRQVKCLKENRYLFTFFPKLGRKKSCLIQAHLTPEMLSKSSDYEMITFSCFLYNNSIWTFNPINWSSPDLTT